MGYHEIGIGAMTFARTFIGTAVRMAQDLGMHRNVEDWRCPAQDRGLSSIPNLAPRNSEERRRIWFGYVVVE